MAEIRPVPSASSSRTQLLRSLAAGRVPGHADLRLIYIVQRAGVAHSRESAVGIADSIGCKVGAGICHFRITVVQHIRRDYHKAAACQFQAVLGIALFVHCKAVCEHDSWRRRFRRGRIRLVDTRDYLVAGRRLQFHVRNADVAPIVQNRTGQRCENQCEN